ncbi:uncharacterized protein DS421_7g215110 [Arachis hypogaea]|nr:uncharacterized protein DS421_7g215110 [Arachis hypogaea]
MTLDPNPTKTVEEFVPGISMESERDNEFLGWELFLVPLFRKARHLPHYAV